MSPRPLFLSLASLLLAAGCDVYDASLVSGGSATGLPVRPAASTEGDDVNPLVVALRGVSLAQGESWKTTGYNLDGRVTTPANGDQECLPSSGNVAEDGPGGIDNVFGQSFFPLIGVVEELETLEDEAQEAQARGKGTILLHMSGWNGTLNDPLVHVEIVQAAAGTSAAPEDVHFVGEELLMVEGGQAAPPPAWDGGDSWWARSDTYLGGDPDKPNIYDDDAYVSDGVVVVALPDRGDIYFFAGDKTVVVRLTGAVATAHITPTLDGVSNVTVAGRWSAQDLEATAPYLGLCDAGIVTLIRQQAMAQADVRSNGKPSESPCDAISMGVSFEEGVKGSFVGLEQVVSPTTLCTIEDADGGV